MRGIESMKILILGLICSQWTVHFVESCLLDKGYEVWMVRRKNSREDDKYIKVYQQLGIHFINCIITDIDIKNGRKNKNYLKVFKAQLEQIKLIKKAGPFDLINLHYVDSDDMIYAPVLKKLTKSKLIFSYWGSDLFRTGDRQLYFRGIFARCADYITFDNKDLQIKFNKVYRWADEVPTEVILFGLSVLDIIKEKYKNQSLSDIRKRWKIPNDKIVVAVGYNGHPQQQHIKILKAIEKMDETARKRIVLLLQMTYGGSKEYRRKVLVEAKKTGCEYREICQFLSDDEVAELRIMTDIYINAQTTDAFSGSVCENLFAGTKLLNASWLRYQEFKEYNFKYWEFNKIEELGQFIKTAMEQEVDCSQNRELIWRLRSWEFCALKWERMFRSLIKYR